MNRWSYDMFYLLMDNRSANETINLIKMWLWTFRFLKAVLSLLICISLNSVRTRVSCVVIMQTCIATKLVDLASIRWSSHRLCVGHSAVFLTQRLVSYYCVWVCVWVLFFGTIPNCSFWRREYLETHGSVEWSASILNKVRSFYRASLKGSWVVLQLKWDIKCKDVCQEEWNIMKRLRRKKEFRSWKILINFTFHCLASSSHVTHPGYSSSRFWCWKKVASRQQS